MTANPTNPELVEQVLIAAVEIGVGTADARPRPGQLALAQDIAEAMSLIGNGESGRGHVSGEAGVGIGKSFAGLSNAAVRAVKYGERTIFSTKSLGLQAQIVDKDAPVVSQAAERVLGKGFTTAVLKGWANSVCGNRTFEFASALIGEDSFGNGGPAAVKPLLAKLRKLPSTGRILVDGIELDLAEMKPLAIWSLEQMMDDSASGDKDTYEGVSSETGWRSVTVGTEECVGLDVCPFAEMCKSDRARNRAAEADVVVANHSLLSVQASLGLPVVLNSARLGPFEHLIIDEAHELPKVVRSQGECSVSGRRLGSLIRAVKTVADERNNAVANWIDQGYQIAELVEQELHKAFTAKSSGEVGKLVDGDDPLSHTGDGVIAWARIGGRLMQKPLAQAQASGKMKTLTAGKRAQASIDSLCADVNAVRKHFKGQARWLAAPPAALPVVGRKKPPRPWYTAQAAPVEVGGMLRANLWTQTLVDPDTGEETDISPSVTCMSGTMPPGFIMDAGLSARATTEYELPFKEAYQESMLYIPAAKTPDAIHDLTIESWGGRRRFSTDKHVTWALSQMYELLDANRGHALILSATARAGQKYVQELKAHANGRWNVYSQWDAGSPRLTLAKWKADHSGVLVGTQGLMTGVDAPGETCSLVILDRPPRAAGNAVDDARVELIAERMGGDKSAEFTAKRLVYVADAVEKMGQSRGRLVRGQNDRGMFAVLDPRMLKNHTFTYEESARRDMMNAVDVFGQKTTELGVATAFLRGRRRSADAA